MSSAIQWTKEKWKALLAFAGLVITALGLYLKTKNQKKVLQKANEAHKKENKVNQESNKEIEQGLEKIRKDQIDKIEKVSRDQEAKSKDLKSKKEEFVKRAEKDESLAEKIANSIGADFVSKD